MKNKLTIRGAEVVFASLTDEGFGTSVTIKVTPEIEEQLNAFYKENQIGNEKTVIGKPGLKEYEGTKQHSIKINANTRIAYINSATAIGYGSDIDVIINAFEYNNKFTKGKTYIGASASAIVVKSNRRTGADSDLSELLGNYSGDAVSMEPTPGSSEGDGDLPF